MTEVNCPFCNDDGFPKVLQDITGTLKMITNFLLKIEQFEMHQKDEIEWKNCGP